MPQILIVSVVGMSQITSTWIIGLTKPNYNTPRISSSRYEMGHKSNKDHIVWYKQSDCNTIANMSWNSITSLP